MNPRAVAAGLLALSGLAAFPPAAAVEPDAPWAVRLPQADSVVYRGALSLDATSGGGGMMYPAPNVAGFLAAIITHAVIAQSAQAAERQKQQEEADRVLAPLRPALDGFGHRDLVRLAIPHLQRPTAPSVLGAQDTAPLWIVAIAPVFSLTQDRRALVLDNVLAIHRPGEANPAYAATVRVVSAPLSGGDPDQEWLAVSSSEPRLRQESAHLLAHSISLALEHARRPVEEGTAFRTIRYPEGSVERVERAQVVDAACHRLVLRTLRGGLMSVPTSGQGAGCQHAGGR